MALQLGHDDNFPAVRLDNLPADDIFDQIIPSLDKDVGTDQLDHRYRSVLLENNQPANAFKRGEDREALGRSVHRPIFPF